MKEFHQLLQNVLTVGVIEPKTLAATDNISIHNFPHKTRTQGRNMLHMITLIKLCSTEKHVLHQFGRGENGLGSNISCMGTLCMKHKMALEWHEML